MNIPPKDLRYIPGTDLLPPPMVLDISSIVLYVAAVPDSGVVVRIRVYQGIALNDTVQLSWIGQDEASSYQAKLSVRDTERFLDFVVPKSVLLAHPGTPPGRPVGQFQVRYQVFPASGGPNMESAVTSLYLSLPLISSTPPPEVPSANAGQIDPDKIPDPGLTILFPKLPHYGKWVSYGRDGRVMYDEQFGVGLDLSVVISRPVLNLTENGGEIRITYYGGNAENIIIDSFPTVLQVVRSQ